VETEDPSDAYRQGVEAAQGLPRFILLGLNGQPGTDRYDIGLSGAMWRGGLEAARRGFADCESPEKSDFYKGFRQALFPEALFPDLVDFDATE
jgi:hypothetical protein